MHIALIGDAFPPMKTSGAVQMRDLYLEFIKQGHQTTFILPSPELNRSWSIEDWEGGQILRVKAPKTKDLGYFKRTLAELSMPFIMIFNLKKSCLVKQRWDGIVWYSPTIFWGPLVKFLQKNNTCRGYLILRDIFPEWAVDLGILKRGLAYHFFKLFENFQYSIADVIGVQSDSNLDYFKKNNPQANKQRVEVLQNWIADTPNIGCRISTNESGMAGKKIFVYAGNMGIAQGMDKLLDLAEGLNYREDVCFLFVGRGSFSEKLRLESLARSLKNTFFFNEIEPSEIPGLLEQCHFGLVVLDPRHKTHNVPGKFLSYLQSGLPVLAFLNSGNDLEQVINKERVGKVCTNNSKENLVSLAEDLINEINLDVNIKARCKALSKKLYSPKTAVEKILKALIVK